MITNVLELLAVFQGGLSVAATGTIFLIYWRRRLTLKYHVIPIVISHLLLILTICLNVIGGHVTMPTHTALMAIGGFLLSNYALTRLIVRRIIEEESH